MATIDTSRSASPTAVGATDALAVQLRSSGLSFEIDQENGFRKLATKVNGAAQWVFNVKFNRSGHSATPGAEEFKATIPLHAPTLKEALIILQAFGHSIRDKTPQEFNEMIRKLSYSAVEVIAPDKKGDYQVRFTRQDSLSARFESKPHIDYTLTSSVHRELEQYVQVLQSNNTPLPADTAVTGQVSLEQVGASVPHVAVELQARETPAERSAREYQERKERFKPHKRALREAITTGRATNLEPFKELFGDAFVTNVETRQRSVPFNQALKETAETMLTEQLQRANKQQAITEMLAQLRKILTDAPAASDYHLNQFYHLVDVAIKEIPVGGPQRSTT